MYMDPSILTERIRSPKTEQLYMLIPLTIDKPMSRSFYDPVYFYILEYFTDAKKIIINKT